MTLFQVYLRALGELARERTTALVLTVANIAIGLVLLVEPVLFGAIVDRLTRGESPWSAIALWAAIGLAGIASSVVVAVTADRLAHRQRLVAMGEAFERAITLPISYHAERGTGAVIRTILDGTSALFATWLSVLREQASALVSVVLMVPVAVWLDWRMAMLLLLLAALYTALNVIVIMKTSGGQSEVERYHMAVSSRVGDALTNIPVVQSYARLQTEAHELRGLMRNLLDAQYPVLTWWGVLAVLTRAASTITIVAVFALGAWLLSRGEMTVGAIVSFVGFANLLIAKLDLLSGFVTRLFMQAPTMRSFFELCDAAIPISDDPKAPAIVIHRGAISYRNVTFRYGAGDEGVFDLSFDIAPGSTVALVGPTGSGKTTTLALLQRLRDPEAGTILVDDQDIRSVSLNSLRHGLAVVFQDAGLFNRSIEENICVGRPSATRAEIEAAARKAGAHDFISAKPAGYAFIAGERGAALSGGERQRIAIARALLKDAPLLLLDEATSALDTGTEAKIKTALDEVRKGRTTIIIAHRLSTVADADQILVFDRGRIVERGRFSTLVEAGGLFASLVKAGEFVTASPDA